MHPFYKRAADLKPIIRIDDSKELNLLEPDYADYLKKVENTIQLLIHFNDGKLAKQLYDFISK
jgi:hypothetical protein